MRTYSAAFGTLTILALGAAATNAQQAADRSPQPVSASEQSVVEAIARAEPSIVAISRRSPSDANAAEQRNADAFSELRETSPTDADSSIVACGVIIDRAGLVLTQYLAVRDGEQHSVHTVEGKTYPAKIRAADPRSGLAVLEITPSASSLQRTGEPAKSASGSFPAIQFADASNLRKGQSVIVIGNPFAIATDGQPSASLGIITNIARKAPPNTNLNDAPGPAKDFRTTIHHLGTLLQTDAKLGWSTGGGALVNLRGELVGITTTAAAIAGHEQPAGYAIPMSTSIRRVIETLKQGREVEYGMLGVGFGPDPFATDVSHRSPLSLAVIYPTGPAARAGLLPDDVITHINNRPVADVDAVQLGVSALSPGAVIDIAYTRDGKSATAQATLAKLAVAGKTIATMQPKSWRGMRVDYATTLDALALKQAIDSGAFDKQGCVLVSDVERDSVAWRAGVRPGMFVSHVAGQRVSTPEEFRAAVQKLGDKLDLKFTMPLSTEAAAKEISN